MSHIFFSLSLLSLCLFFCSHKVTFSDCNICPCYSSSSCDVGIHFQINFILEYVSDVFIALLFSSPPLTPSPVSPHLSVIALLSLPSLSLLTPLSWVSDPNIPFSFCDLIKWMMLNFILTKRCINIGTIASTIYSLHWMVLNFMFRDWWTLLG